MTKNALENDNTRIGVIRCIVTTPARDGEWEARNIFHTFVKCGDKICKVVIDGGNTMNVVSQLVVAKLELQSKPHSQPFRVA